MGLCDIDELNQLGNFDNEVLNKILTSSHAGLKAFVFCSRVSQAVYFLFSDGTIVQCAKPYMIDNVQQYIRGGVEFINVDSKKQLENNDKLYPKPWKIGADDLNKVLNNYLMKFKLLGKESPYIEDDSIYTGIAFDTSNNIFNGKEVKIPDYVNFFTRAKRGYVNDIKYNCESFISGKYTFEIDKFRLYDKCELVQLSRFNCKIDSNIFDRCINLKSLNIPINCNILDANFLIHCENLESLVFEDCCNVSILRGSLGKLDKLKYLRLPRRVYYYRYYEFGSLANIEKIEAPKLVPRSEIIKLSRNCENRVNSGECEICYY